VPCQRVWWLSAWRPLVLVGCGMQLPWRRRRLPLLPLTVLAEELRQRLLRFLEEAARKPCNMGLSVTSTSDEGRFSSCTHACHRGAPGLGAAAVEPCDHGPTIHRRHQQAEPAAPGHLQVMYLNCNAAALK
jgi:hypothetical protein